MMTIFVFGPAAYCRKTLLSTCLDRFRLIALLVLPFVLAGCSLTGLTGADPDRLKPSKDTSMLVARDLVETLVTVEGYSPDDGALQIKSAQSDFGYALSQQLQDAGYELENVLIQEGPRYVSFRIDSLQNESGASESYRLLVGAVELNREYVQDNFGVYPVSALEINGVTHSKADKKTGTSRAVASVTSANRKGAFDALGTHDGNAVAASASLVDETTDKVPPAADEPALSAALPVDPSKIKRENMYKTRKSNFAEFTKGYEGIEKTVLEFPNDSLRLTDEVLKTIKSMSGKFDAETDVISVIGCSHGKTSIENGNQLLALGRSKRVQQQLIGYGIPVNRILDEGCWAPIHFDEMMPRRGVVLHLKRAKSRQPKTQL